MDVAKDSIGVIVKIEGLKETQDAFRALPANVDRELHDASNKIATDLADAIRADAAGQGRQARILAPTVKANRDSLSPNVTAGGDSLIGRHRKPAYKLLFGSEFGATFLKQFKPRNTVGYWFYPTVTRLKDEMTKRWTEGVDRALDEWGA